jgi:hypothetical protein
MTVFDTHDPNGIASESDSGLAVIEAEHRLVPTTAVEIHNGESEAEPLGDAASRTASVPIPDDERFAGQAYLDAPALAAIARELIESKSRFSHLRQFRIDYLWKRKGGKAKGQTIRGGCRLGSDLIGFYSDVQFVIWLAADVCREKRYTRHEIEAALHHELMHAGVHDVTGVPVIWPHDFEGFVAELDEYGDWTIELQNAKHAFRQMRLFPAGGGA